MAVHFGELAADMRIKHAAVTPKVTKAAGGKAPATVSQGQRYVTNTGFMFDSEVFTADSIENYKTKNLFGRGIQRMQRAMLFRKPYSVEMINPDGKTDEEQSKTLKKMLDRPKVNFYTRMMQSFDAISWFGIAPFEPVCDWKDHKGNPTPNSYNINELTYLPPHTFKTPGQPKGTILNQGHFLKGIVLIEGETTPQYWQTIGKGTVTKQITNCYAMTAPDCELVAGDPTFYPLFPFFEMSKFLLNAAMQQANRIAGPIIIATVPDDSDDDKIKDTKKILRNWNKNTTAIAPEGVTFQVFPFKEGTTLYEAIKIVNMLMISYVSPTQLLNNGSESQRLGGSDNAQAEMINDYSASELTKVENMWEQFLRLTYIEPNGFDDDWGVKITIPAPSIDKSEVNLNKATLVLGSNKRAIVHPNTVREWLDEDDADEKTLAENKAAWDSLGGDAALQSPFGQSPVTQMTKETPLTQSMRRVRQTNSVGEKDLDAGLIKSIDGMSEKVMAILNSVEP